MEPSSSGITEAELYREAIALGRSTLAAENEGLRRENERLSEALAIAENRSENYKRLWEYGEDWPKDFTSCNARSDYKECVFHCTEPAGHDGPHMGGTHGMLWRGESERPSGVIANPPRSVADPDRIDAAYKRSFNDPTTVPALSTSPGTTETYTEGGGQ